MFVVTWRRLWGERRHSCCLVVVVVVVVGVVDCRSGWVLLWLLELRLEFANNERNVFVTLQLRWGVPDAVAELPMKKEEDSMVDVVSCYSCDGLSMQWSYKESFHNNYSHCLRCIPMLLGNSFDTIQPLSRVIRLFYALPKLLPQLLHYYPNQPPTWYLGNYSPIQSTR